ncbi:MAG: glutamate synthase large subunit [Methylacidiphilales bacterium]|nr:glutamate synthase large subunit [Candidatus Methylacidiphilales bacterium]MDW8349523.1 glutamate synthase large subunit [Verrucomicrobiae bacterium]
MLNYEIIRRTRHFRGLYDPSHEHDTCGMGFVVNINGERSYDVLKRALSCVSSLTHRGALDADAKTGDGAGVQTQIPYELFLPEIEKMGHKVYREKDLGVGMLFLPREDEYAQARCRKVITDTLREYGLVVFGFRKVPINTKVLGDKALLTCPQIEQVMIGRPEDSALSDEDYERTLYLARCQIESILEKDGIHNFYACSFSSRTIVYKGLLVSPQLSKFYKDLTSPLYKTALACFHQRYSTNTFPTWPLAHPFRMIAHNGEINTIKGNRIWVAAREPLFQWPFWGDRVKYLRPVIQPGGSDSCSLDNTIELLAMSGRGLLHSMLMLIPSAWKAEPNLSEAERAFYQYHACLNEPWDGPAAVVFTDGRYVGACLDRNGLRPARYKITSDGLFILGSEAGLGLSALEERNIVEKGRLAPGEIIAVDTLERKILHKQEIKKLFAEARPYAVWLKEQLRTLTPQDELPQARPVDQLLKDQLVFGYDEEEIKTILKPMVETGEEAVGSMGDDTPLAVLSYRPRPLYHYFKQQFAQVTNPPIDPIREKLVMGVDMLLGARKNWLVETPEHAHLIHVQHPILTVGELEALKSFPDFKLRTFSVLFRASEAERGLVEALERVCKEAESAVDEGVEIIILSDRGTSSEMAPIPMLLAVAAVHHHLIRREKRMLASIVAEAGDARDVHQLACLIGYGAAAICPYVLWETYAQLFSEGQLKAASTEEVVRKYRAAAEKGLLKIMSKMGISLLSSYHGAQLFDALGVHESVIEAYFTGTSTTIGGVTLKEIARDVLMRHSEAYGEHPKLADAGFYRYRRDGERHAITPAVIQNLHTYVGIKGVDKAGRIEDYRRYVQSVLENAPLSIRDCLEFKPLGAPIPIEEVEPAEEIMRRFTTAGMSLGALSPEAHETLAIAMNRIGGKSNSGEGGEDRARFGVMENGDSKNSRIKQVASGRFGVSAEYLASAAEIEIKMAQGSKPGEGGQLPGHKVNALIARLRNSVPGVMLISPPPHHDIYSIEDLAQLIYDLKQVNPRAKICVKLVAETGVGTIAAGVAKAHADIILISGDSGGTGASPLSSIKFAGMPWEIGIAEAQQVLLLNGLRSRVTLRTDGGMKTGRDILVAAMLGAEEYNFGTIALIAAGCVYVRQCHLNTCPVGVATQDERLRAKFRGSPENIIHFFNGITQEIREIMASLGIRTMNEIIGRADLLRPRLIPDHPKIQNLDFSRLLAVPELDEGTPRYHTWEQNERLEDRPLDEVLIQDAKEAIRTKRPTRLKYKVSNVNRSIGTQLSGDIAFTYGDAGLPDGTLDIRLSGSAGQSLGAFLVRGVKITLTGEANDYVGKGMSGGTIVVVPPPGAKFFPNQNIIVGNTCLYGATGGELFALGGAGERFAVRNSGATAIVEGVGDHGCEYMTGGTVVVLGPTGKNFAAGMSGGIAYVYDEEDAFPKRVNLGMVSIERLTDPQEVERLRLLIQKYQVATDSAKAHRLLAAWGNTVEKFWKVVPHPPQVVVEAGVSRS